MQHPIYAAEFIMYAAVSHGAVSWPAHAHECFELLYVLEGDCRIETEDGTAIASAHDLIIFKPYQLHQETQLSPVYALVCMRFPGEFIGEHGLPFPEFASLPTVVHLPQDDTFRVLLDRVVAEYQHGDEYRHAMISTYLFQFAVQLCRTLREQPPLPAHTPLASYMQQLLEQHITSGVAIRDLARQMHMSESHFSHRVKELLGIAPQQYVRERRIARARQLLESTPMSIEEIAAALGYDEPTSFFRAFKRVTGVTPGEARGKR